MCPRSVLRLLFAVILAALPGCLPLPGDVSLNHKTCAPNSGDDALIFKIESTTDLPNVISGTINQSLWFDECQTVPSLFTITREDSRHATLTIIAAPGTKVGDEYFDDAGKPYPDAAITYSLYGRRYCSDDALTFQHEQIPIVWQAQFTDGPDCPATRFTSTIE